MTELTKESKSHKAIRLAIVRIEKGKPKTVDIKRKMSISAVAEEAGFSRNIIHRDCPDLLERIRGGINKGIRKQRDEKQLELSEYKSRNKELRAKNDELNKINAYLQSKNATLIAENKRLATLLGSHSNIVKFE